MPDPPNYLLADLHQLARDAPLAAEFNFDKSVDVVSDRLDLDLKAAKAFILEQLQYLTDDDFVKPVNNYRPPCDLYGMMARGICWYVKIGIATGGGLLVQAFHPPTGPLRTKAGTLK